MGTQHCYKYYMGLLNEDMTMIKHLILYIDTIGEEDRTVVVPGLDKTFHTEDMLQAFTDAMKYIQDHFEHYDNDKTFVTPAWQGETEYIKHDIPYEDGKIKMPEGETLDTHDQILQEFGQKLLEKQEKLDPEIVEIVDKNFWELV